MDKKSKTFGGISSALLKENFRQQWYVPALLFILYFLAGIFPILMMEREERGSYAITSLDGYNAFFMMFIAYMPLIAACIVMRYYHRPDMAFAMHAEPYSRARLFNTNILTGWLFMSVPVVITGLIYMALSGSVLSPVYGNGTVDWEQTYAIKDVLMWILESISLYTFYYGLCILAGALVGNTVTQILGSLVFYAVVPALAGIVYLYSSYCLPGYDEASDTFLRIILYSEPLMGEMLSQDSLIVLPDRIWYLAAGVLLIVLSGFICRRAKLEKVGDSMIFSPVEAVVAVVITFIGGAILGLLFGFVFEGGLGMFLLGALIGAAISFFLVKLILERSVRIFNKVNMKTFAASVIITALFITAFATDIAGYGTKVPADSDIASVNVKGISENVLRLNDCDTYDSEGVYIRDSVFTEDRDFIEKVTALHRHVADNKLYDFGEDENAPSMEVQFEYKLKNGRTFRRSFRIRVDETAEEQLKDIVNDDAVDEVWLIPESLKTGASRAEFDIQFWSDGEDTRYLYGEIPISGRADIARIIDAYNSDKKDRTIDEVAYIQYPDGYEGSEGYSEPESSEYLYAYVSIYYDRTGSLRKGINKNYAEYEPCVRIGISRDDSAAIELLKELYEKYPADMGV